MYMYMYMYMYIHTYIQCGEPNAINLPVGDGWNPPHKNGDLGDCSLLDYHYHFNRKCIFRMVV